ncbi:hypothetical protein [Aeromonas veronii]|uniref:hypothetical protein n=1 Tax=Aeromonas veronii TaxID=654 RepID=UPI003B986BC5
MAVNGIRRNLIPRDDLFIDYLWYRTCQINGYSDYRTPSRSELEIKVQNATRTSAAIDFMCNSDISNDKPFGLERWVDILKFEFEQNCLNQDDFLWLENNNRQLYYIWRLLEHLIKTQPLNHILPNSSFILKFMPTSDVDNAKKMGFMEEISTLEVNKHTIANLINRLRISKTDKADINDRIKNYLCHALLNDKLVDWFKTDRDAKANWLHIYLSKTTPEYRPLISRNSKHLTDDIISFFDVLFSFNEDKFNLMLMTMKKAWGQHKYRENNKEKKQYSINMSHDVGDILDKLSLARNENKNAIVEALIRAEYNKLPR